MSILRRMFEAAVETAKPSLCLPPALPAPPPGRTLVIGAGKAAAAMARSVEDNWTGPLSGLVVTRYGHSVPTRRIEVAEAAHPVPDAAGAAAAARMIEMLGTVGPDDLVLCLISGGGSALLACPAPDITLTEKQSLTGALLRSGAAIGEINCVRKHLSAVKGGRLAALAAPARLVTLAISDVPGDDPSVIASGPTVPDPTTLDEARGVLAKYGITPSPAIAARLIDPAAETPKTLSQAEYHLIATPQRSLEAAALVAARAGFMPLLLGDALEGEAREMAKVMAGIVRSIRAHQQPVPMPAVILSGGEATVTIRGIGKGGPNAEFALALALALKDTQGVDAIACDTDGIDGTEDNAGALITPDTLERARSRGLHAEDYLRENDSYGFFNALGDLVKIGPTLTNVNDFRAILVR
ncbi:D-glycerate 2-kinase [Paramagnetospirillum magnetotacticum MS-1]|uniref:D-glycerate 2-kinase n=1 Tax=Paramagnetospirillum magnetotacticum MS-1 TaxID=272627 RepID=A0A0C2YGT3_PARME|nr:glycerate kinase [Paramagnetospirillum magnetotacticum]KIL98959.1 D-glycerate 2-kinase [Paramagnetospirillum magnetotacticum MS-1]